MTPAELDAGKRLVAEMNKTREALPKPGVEKFAVDRTLIANGKFDELFLAYTDALNKKLAKLQSDFDLL
jgi:hypothetical protein